MPQQLKNLGKPPQIPKKRMPQGRAMMMIGTALCLSVLIFMFSLFPITAPMMIGVGSGLYAEQYTGSKTVGEAVGWTAGTFTGAAEFVSGVGVAMIDFIGEIMVFALTLLGWVIFYAWFISSGIQLIGGKSANKRFVIAGASIIIGMIPFIDIIPGLLIGVVLIVISVRNEDRKNLLRYKQQLKKYIELQKTSLSRRTAMQQATAVNRQQFQ